MKHVNPELITCITKQNVVNVIYQALNACEADPCQKQNSNADIYQRKTEPANTSHKTEN